MISCEWAQLGHHLRIAADDAYHGETPSVDVAFSFLLENPECFDAEEWPADMPREAPLELIVAYYGVGEVSQ